MWTKGLNIPRLIGKSGVDFIVGPTWAWRMVLGTLEEGKWKGSFHLYK
jgi:hypothetical protein